MYILNTYIYIKTLNVCCRYFEFSYLVFFVVVFSVCVVIVGSGGVCVCLFVCV